METNSGFPHVVLCPCTARLHTRGDFCEPCLPGNINLLSDQRNFTNSESTVFPKSRGASDIREGSAANARADRQPLYAGLLRPVSALAGGGSSGGTPHSGIPLGRGTRFCSQSPSSNALSRWRIGQGCLFLARAKRDERSILLLYRTSSFSCPALVPPAL
jgi:hypothetical protein